MLQRLFLENLILVDSSEILFSKGYTAITGETGSGKSILLTAIGLLLGERADPSYVRHGEPSGIVEGTFLLPSSPSINALFEETGVEKSTLCTVRREISSAGKSRATVNGCAVPLSLLKRLGEELIELSSQHAYLSLYEESTPKGLLDRFASLEKEAKDFQALFEKQRSLIDQHKKLLSEEPLRTLEMERLHTQLQEIETAKIFEIDDEALFTRLQELENSKEILDTVESLTNEIDGGKEPLTKRLFRLQQKAEALRSLSPRFSSCCELIEGSSITLKEAAQALESEKTLFEYSEDERTRITEKIRRIDYVKKTYGPTPSEIKEAIAVRRERLSALEARDDVLEALLAEIKALQEVCDKAASSLTKKRKNAAPLFEKAVHEYLQLLHMPQALFHVELHAVPRYTGGDEKVRLYLTPNIGEKKIEVNKGASGGEMARLFLAIQAVMARLSLTPTIIFDEIDASIGGITASAVGDVLSAIGKERQVFAITHFSQVAAKAAKHISICKETSDGRTLSKIRLLASQKEREKEHARMSGKPQ